MSSISSLSSALSSSLLSSTQRSQRSDATKKFDDLFAQLDTASKGYLTESDLQTALSQVASANASTSSSSTTSSSSSSSASIDEIFSKLDSNSDGKVTQDELSTGLENLTQALDSQFNQMRMGGGMPPPPSDDAGFTQDQLTSQLSAIGSSDSTRSDLLTKIANNFTAADTNSDGKVSFKEAMSYDQQNPTSSSSSTASNTSASSASSASSTSATSSTSSDLAIMKRLMELMQTYASNDTGSSSLLNTLSILA